MITRTQANTSLGDTAVMDYIGVYPLFVYAWHCCYSIPVYGWLCWDNGQVTVNITVCLCDICEFPGSVLS